MKCGCAVARGAKSARIVRRRAKLRDAIRMTYNRLAPRCRCDAAADANSAAAHAWTARAATCPFLDPRAIVRRCGHGQPHVHARRHRRRNLLHANGLQMCINGHIRTRRTLFSGKSPPAASLLRAMRNRSTKHDQTRRNPTNDRTRTCARDAACATRDWQRATRHAASREQ
jgi:hypothetical protein